MSRLSALALLLVACSDYNINEKDDNSEIPDGDTNVECPPQIPDCRDSEPPDSPVDSEPIEPTDCDVEVTEAGVVAQVAECEGIDGGGSVTDPWNLVVEYQHNGGGANVVMPAIGNLDDDNGDGVVDENDIPDIAYVGWSTGTLVAVSGDGSGELFRLSGFRGDGGVLIADVDADGAPELIAADNQGRIHSIDGSGNTEWTSAAFSLLYPVSTVADIDADGMPEVIFDLGVVRGDTGATVATLTPSNFWRAPIAADLDQDGTHEIILADKVFDHQGNVEWSSSLTGTSAFAAVANIDNDPEAEVFMTIGNNMGIYEHDGTLIRTVPVPGANSHPGPPCMADFDGDGEVEIGVPEGSAISVF
ncbi:MAG: VCBS repeat-containing protein, partial [Alphaproteobacteria bacterium]|nr:VCBS repeat-containing protein [Alphaproteobacteria bacterium]